MSALRTSALDHRVRAVVGLAPPCHMKHNVRGTMLYAPMRHQTQLVMMGGEPDEVPEHYELVQAIRLCRPHQGAGVAGAWLIRYA